MNIPKNYNTLIPKELFCNYILSDEHPIGKIKAGFFNKYRFTISNWQELREQILLFPKKYSYSNFECVYKVGMIYKVTYNGNIVCPDQRSLYVSTLWLLNTTSENLELLTISII